MIFIPYVSIKCSKQYMKSDLMMDHRVLTPIHKYQMAQRSILKEHNITEVESAKSERLVDLHVPSLTEVKIPLENVGSSKSRSTEQSERARNIIIQDLQADNSDITAFTDGSALGNPGPCGAGAAVYIGSLESNPIDLIAPVSKHSSSFSGELSAILLVLNFLVDYIQVHTFNKLRIFCDCQSVISVVTSYNFYPNHHEVIDKIRSNIEILHNHSVSTLISWIGGHIDLGPNDRADYLAKEAAKQSLQLQTSPLRTYDHENP